MIRKFLAGVLLSVFVFIFMPVALAVGVYKTFLDPDFYHGEFIELVYDFAIDELPRNVDLSGIPLSEQDLKGILATVFAEEDLSLLVDSIFDELSSIEVGPDGLAYFTLPLDWLSTKSDMIAERVSGFLVDKLTVCDSNSDLSSEVFECIPNGVSKLDFKNHVMSELDRQLFSDIPNEVSFTLQFPAQIRGNVFSFFDSLMLKVLLIGVLILVLLLFLIALLIFRPWILVLRWIAKSLFFASLTVFVLMMTLLHLPMEWLGEFGYDAIGRIYSFVVSALISNMFVYIFPILVFSFVIWVLMMIMYKRTNKFINDSC